MGTGLWLWSEDDLKNGFGGLGIEAYGVAWSTEAEQGKHPSGETSWKVGW